jgi:hypothetical protein
MNTLPQNQLPVKHSNTPSANEGFFVPKIKDFAGFKSSITAYYNKTQKRKVEINTPRQLLESYVKSNLKKIDLDLFVSLKPNLVTYLDKFLKRKKRVDLKTASRYKNSEVQRY